MLNSPHFEHPVSKYHAAFLSLSPSTGHPTNTWSVSETSTFRCTTRTASELAELHDAWHDAEEEQKQLDDEWYYEYEDHEALSLSPPTSSPVNTWSVSDTSASRCTKRKASELAELHDAWHDAEEEQKQDMQAAELADEVVKLRAQLAEEKQEVVKLRAQLVEEKQARQRAELHDAWRSRASVERAELQDVQAAELADMMAKLRAQLVPVEEMQA